jgi:ABC-type arginine/histidine transport system permease subunit
MDLMEIAQGNFPIDVDVPTTGAPAVNVNAPALSIGEIVSRLLPYLFAGAGLLLLLFLLYGGISLMLSRGDPKAVQSAKDKITGAVVGFVIVFAAYWIVQIVATLLGLQTKVGGIFGL